MKQHPFLGVTLVLVLFAASDAAARTPARQRIESDPARRALIDRTGAALLDQIRCRKTPQVARAINAMLKSRLIRYVDNESGVYYFKPAAPLTILGLNIRYISGFDCCAVFKGVPDSRMLGPAPPPFLEIVVAAPAGELRKRALDAGLVEAVPYENKLGFGVEAGTEPGSTVSLLTRKRRGDMSTIECVDYSQ